MTLPPYEKHRAERDWYDAAREQEAADAARAEREWRLREELESPDAEESRWSGIFGRMAYERPQVWHDDRPAIDRRLYAVEGDLIEQARRDRDVPTLPRDVA